MLYLVRKKGGFDVHVHVHVPKPFSNHCVGIVVLYAHCQLIHAHGIVVSWFLQCMGYVPREGCMYMYFRGRSPRKCIQHEGGTIPCTVKTMRQLTCTDRPYSIKYRTLGAVAILV